MCRIKKVILVACLLAFVGAAQPAKAFYPTEWVYHSGSFAYSMDTMHWYHIDPGGAATVWAFDYASGTWVPFTAIADGWTYYRWPHAFSLNEGKWYFLSPTAICYCFNLVTENWSAFGQAPYSEADLSGIWKVKYIRPVDYTNDKVWDFIAITPVWQFTGFGLINGVLDNNMAGYFGITDAGSVWGNLTSYGSFGYAHMNLSRTCAVGGFRLPTASRAHCWAMLKQGTVPTMAQLAGRWVFAHVTSSSSAVDPMRWQRIVMDVAAGGTATISVYDESGTLQEGPTVCGAFINGAGDLQVTISAAETVTMAVNSLKDTMTYAARQSGGDRMLGIGVKQPATCSWTDVAGTWRASCGILMQGAPPLDGYVYTLTILPSTTTTTTGTLAIQGLGAPIAVTFSNLTSAGGFRMIAGSNIGVQVNVTKDVMVTTESPGGPASAVVLLTFVKMGE